MSSEKSIRYGLRVVKKKDGTMEWRDDDPPLNELDTMKAVMEWASCNVDSATAPSIKGQVWMVIVNNAVFKAPTLYQALHIAWEKRDQ